MPRKSSGCRGSRSAILLAVGLIFCASLLQADSLAPIAESRFCASLTPGKYILPAKEGWWNWCTAPIYDESGKLHLFVSAIPNNGDWKVDSVIQHFTADSMD
ncbi:MAG: hypothetical protein ACO3FQ_08970, partial [Terrimicrobiaceae bacterium]